jgi:hypothetical protein
MTNNLTTPVDIQLQTDELFTAWAKITIDRLYEALSGLGIALDGPLRKSIQTEVIKADGDVEAVILKFLRYGRFVDMGVGKGVTLADVHKLTKKGKPNKRRSKTWFSKTYYAEVLKVKLIYIKKFNREIPLQIKEALFSQIEISA